MEQVRSFIAIELPGEVQAEFGRLQSALQAAGPFPVKWVDPHGIHLTLKFLGNIAAGRTGEIIDTIKEATRGIPPFRLEVGTPGVFPGVGRTRVAWVGLRGDTDSLARLQQLIETSLGRLGFTREKRAFTAHLTLARVRDQASAEEQRRFGQAFIQARLSRDFIINVYSINLMKSQLTRERAVYSRMGTVALVK